jgi:hypothetical protein
MNVCPVCGIELFHPIERSGHRARIQCRRCGTFDVSDTCLAILGDNSKPDGLLNDEFKKAAVGHWLRQHQSGGASPLLDSRVAETLAKEPWFPSLQDQRENMLKYIGSMSDGPGHSVEFDFNTHQYIIGSRVADTVEAIADRLQREELIKLHDDQGYDELSAELTFEGWLAFENIASGKTTGRRAFMAMPFNKPDLDTEWYPKLQKAVGQTGFTLLRVDEHAKPGLIDIVMQERIREARFLIVELTHANLGAYWEAGFATGLGKPVIYTLRKGEKAHFDVEHWLRIEWDPENMIDALERVKATIRTALPDARLEPA